MGMLDNIKDKAKDMMDDPDKKEKIEQFAREKGMSIEDAKKHFMNRDKQE